MQLPDRRMWLVLAAALWLATIGLQTWIDPDRHYYAPRQQGGGAMPQVYKESAALFGGILLGFREVAAGLLWVRADEYFHSGKYDELVPIFYIVTWLDPHQIDVYSTGAWHLAYNLGDQRLIPEGVKFLDKGIKDNPNIYDLYFQQAYMHYHKLHDYQTAEKYAQEAVKHPGTDGEPAPYYIHNTIAHSMRANGQIDAMFDQWNRNIAFSWKQLEPLLRTKGGPAVGAALDAAEKEYGSLPLSQQILKYVALPSVVTAANKDPNIPKAMEGMLVQVRNLNVNILRREFFRKGAGQPGYKFDFTASPPHWVPSGDNQRHQINTHFDFHVVKVAPRKLKVIGRLEGADFQDKLEHHRLYTRLDVWFRDKNFARRFALHADDFTWQKANLTTFKKQVSFPTEDTKPGQDSTEFSFILDFSKDPDEMDHKPTDLFPMKADAFDLTVSMDPVGQSEFHQDVYGWKGEGLTDDKHLVVDERGVRTISKTVTLPRWEVL